MSITNVSDAREALLRAGNVLPADYCPKVLHFIETLKDDWDDDDEPLDPPIPVEDDPFFTPEHLERLRQREKDMNEGRSKVIPFTPEEWTEFWQEVQHSPKEAEAKALSRACYLTSKQS